MHFLLPTFLVICSSKSLAVTASPVTLVEVTRGRGKVWGFPCVCLPPPKLSPGVSHGSSAFGTAGCGRSWGWHLHGGDSSLVEEGHTKVWGTFEKSRKVTFAGMVLARWVMTELEL